MKHGILAVVGVRSRLRELLVSGNAVVLYESPFRIVKLLTDIADIDSDRTIVIGRELTKLHEEIIEGTAAELRDDFAGRPSIKGEFAVFERSIICPPSSFSFTNSSLRLFMPYGASSFGSSMGWSPPSSPLSWFSVSSTCDVRL